MTEIFMSIICGALIGVERRRKQKAAGMKTLALIAMGSTLFTMISLALPGDKTRMLSNIITGIGFLGAGCVFRDTKEHVSGLTTAATIWVVAALGIMCGLGFSPIAFMMAVLVTLMLTVGAWIENKMFPYGEAVASAKDPEQPSLPLKKDCCE